MPDTLRLDEHLVPGCQVRLWFVSETRDGLCRFQTDSDAVTLKALTGLFCDLANDLPPEQIRTFDAGFLEQLGILKQLAESRRATVLRVAEAMREFARGLTSDPGCQIPDATQNDPQSVQHSLSGIGHQGSGIGLPSAYFFDAHNHLQDERLAGQQDTLVAACHDVGVRRMVVNGTRESDWPRVAELARRFPETVLPSFGHHPWYLGEQTADWREHLVSLLDQTPNAAIGEIGIDRWILDQTPQSRARHGADWAEREPASMEEQEEAFVWQLRLAAERNRPVSIHCLQAYGRLEELLKANPRPERGFLLHSYGGPVEMVAGFAKLGAYFGFPGYFLHERKHRQRDVFRAVPPDRLLVETDAPDQSPPDPEFQLTDVAGNPLNHPANLGAVYRGLAAVLDRPLEELAAEAAANFRTLFGA